MVSSRRTGTNEVISTYGDGTKDYTVMQDWADDTVDDLVTGTRSEILEGYNDAVFDDNVILSGSTTSLLYRRGIRPAPGHKHKGIPGTGVQFNFTGADRVFILNEDNVFVHDFNITHSFNSASTFDVVSLNTNTNMHLVGCLIRGNNSGTGSANGIATRSSAIDSIIANCLVYSTDNHGYIIDAVGEQSYLYNNVSANNGNQGVRRNGGDAILKNTLSHSNITDFFGFFNASSVTNASSDGTAPGTGSRINQLFDFVDELNNNYHLLSTDGGAQNFGTDLSGDSIFPFDDDIDNHPFVIWDIGFDEIVTGVFPRVGNKSRLTSKVGGLLV